MILNIQQENISKKSKIVNYNIKREIFISFYFKIKEDKSRRVNYVVREYTRMRDRQISRPSVGYSLKVQIIFSFETIRNLTVIFGEIK